MDLKLDNDTILKERQAWNRTCLSAGIPAISEDTCARILACLYVHGNNEAFTLSGKFIADIEYLRGRSFLTKNDTTEKEIPVVVEELQVVV